MTEHKSIITTNWSICFNCGKVATDCHHIMNGVNRNKSDKYGLVVPMCHGCHMDLHNSAIRMNHYKRIAQRYFEENYSRGLWMKEFHKNYLED